MNTGFLIAFPLTASLLVLVFKPKQVKKIALGFSLVELALTFYALSKFKINAEPQLMIDWVWLKSFGIHFKAAMDGISLLLVLLTNVLVPLIMMTPLCSEQGKGTKQFYAFILLLQSALVGVFTAMDGFLFYIFWEMALIPIWFICLLWGRSPHSSERTDAVKKITFKFFLYTLTGSLLMLVALIYVYLQTDNIILENGKVVSRTFDLDAMYIAGQNLSSAEQAWIFWALFLAFAIKMPVFPFHTWQPDTYTAAPMQGTMLLAGIMLKMGTYGLLRWLLPLVPLGVQQWGNAAVMLSVISIVYASVIALMQKDFKRLIAYSSIAHVGLISAGMLSLTAQGLQGGMFQMLAHGVNVTGLFFVAGIFFARTKTHEIFLLGGIRNNAPVFATAFLFVLLGSIALPLTNGFVGELFLLTGIYQYDGWTAAFAGLTVILGAVYMLRSYRRTMLGESNLLTASFADLSLNEKIFFAVVIMLVIAMGVYPKPVLDIAEPSVLKIVQLAKPF